MSLSEQHPLKQGLKRVMKVILKLSTSPFRATSIKTRIETNHHLIK
ncbi:conserved protein [Microscilla marina ATCC 23134]|uniref:Conserved protein n=1 Tax=Microscilla marina ATCC 23134 TaxID=313606 RepID=A1ZP47_MICM2|nr:conserved protein [Microscilla marina ATCC 23134]